MATIKYLADAIATVMTTELNALANGSGAIGAEIDNSSTLYLMALFELNVTFASNPTAGALVNMYLVPAPDGTNYDDAPTGAAPAVPASLYVGGFPVRAVSTAQKIALGVGAFGLVQLPPMKFKAYLLNNAGFAFPANGSTLKMVPVRYQSG